MSVPVRDRSKPAPPGLGRVGPVGLGRGQHAHLLVEPLAPVRGQELAGEHLVDLHEMGDVGERVGQLRVGERPARPVGEARGLVDLGLRHVVDELLVGNRIAVAADHGGHLGVEERLRQQAAEQPDDLEVLPGGVEHLHHALVGHQGEERREVEVGRERIDEHARPVRPRHLDEAEFRIVGGLAHELRIDGDEGMRGETVAGLGEGVRGRDQVHGIRLYRRLTPDARARFEATVDHRPTPRHVSASRLPP
jgi:hypothetical protein